MSLQGQNPIQHSKRFSGIRLKALILAAFLIIVGTISAILIQGVWEVTLSLLLTAFGVLLALLQLLTPSTSDTSQAVGVPNESLIYSEGSEILHNQLESIVRSSQLGALVIYADKIFVGRSVVLFGQNFENYEATISQYVVNHQPTVAGIIQNVKPGIYSVTLYSDPGTFRTTISVFAGQLIELRTRKRNLKRNSWELSFH